MSENKFIKRLHGKETAKSVVEIKNTATPTMFTNMPAGDSNVFNTYSDHRGNVTGVLRGTDNWKLSGSSLVPATTVYGDGRDMTGVFVVGNAGLWIDATYTFTEPKLFTPNTEWVLKLCGNGLLSDSNDTVELTMLIKFGSTMVSKTFFLPEQSFSFSEELVIDFSESVAQTIKVNAGDTMVVQVLCGDSSAQAQIYNGMTVLTALQRRVDAETVASDTKTFDEVVDQVDQIQEDLDDLEEYVDDTFVRLDGNSIMTGPLKFEAGSMRGAVSGYLNGVAFWKMSAQHAITNIANLTDSQFLPVTTNSIDIGRSANKWKNLYLSGKAFVSTINNGADINIPTVGGKMAVQVSTMPTASADNVGDVVQFVGATDANYTNGYFYKSTENSGTYSWVQTDIQPNASGLPDQTGNSGKVLTTDGTDASWTDTLATLKLSTALKASDGSNIVEVTGSGNFTFGRVLKTITLNSSFVPYASGSVNLGNATYKFGTLYANYINSGASITIPNYTGTMVVADSTGATQGQVLTLDSNLQPTWANASGGYYPDLFDWKWADRQLNDVQWLRADTFSWQSGSVYQAAFDELFYDIQISTYWYSSGGPGYTKSRTPAAGDAVYLNSDLTTQIGTVDSYDDVNDEITVSGNTYSYMSNTYVTPTTETVAGYSLSVYTGHSGRKIVSVSDETNVANIYTATGVAWYYIIDIPNKRFKLPRTKFGFTGLRDTVGNYVAPGVPNITGSVTGLGSGRSHTYSGSLYQINMSSGTFGGSGGNHIDLGFDASMSDSIYGNSTTVQPPATQMYLYFYVGEFTQTAIENTAGITAETLNDKVDVGHQVIAFQVPNAGNNYTWYRKYADGWVEQGGEYTATSPITKTLMVEMADTNYHILTSTHTGGNLTRTTTNFSIGNCPNIQEDRAGWWEVKGMAAS